MAREQSLSVSRMDGFSDGVFSIAATLLVLDISIHPPGSALERLQHAWPAYLAYLVSFLTIGAAWLSHTALTNRLTRADSLLLRLNLLLLLVIAFLPFPTKVVADALQQGPRQRTYVTLYGLVLLLIRALGWVLDEYASREHLYAADSDDNETRMEERKFLPAVFGYVVAVLVAIVFPGLALVFYFGVAIFLIVPFRELGRLIFRRG
ncbi:MAG TPA: TMEM175 family protein [Acidimicrobiia bacterium]|jgi:uncharacterized membrane protein|nr:TMEM175 family protein [Acidimicrobiia bacterium]